MKKKVKRPSKSASKKKLKDLPPAKAKGIRGGLYMNFGGIKGDSTTEGHEKWIS
jgi:hypothetical protein